MGKGKSETSQEGFNLLEDTQQHKQDTKIKIKKIKKKKRKVKIFA